MITTHGFDVQAAPYVPAIDPRLYAPNPEAITQGALQGIQLQNTLDQQKAFQAQQAELAQTRQARVSQTQALSDLAVLHTQQEQALNDSTTKQALSDLALKTAQNQSNLGQVPDIATTAGAQRAFTQQDLSLKGSTLEASYQAQHEHLQQETQYLKDEGAWRKAEAEQRIALAAKLDRTGVPSEGDKEYNKKLGAFAALVGKTPQDMADLTASGEMGDHGITMAAEIARYATLSEKPNYYDDPKEKLGPKSRAWLGNSGMQAIQKKMGVVTPGNIDLSKIPAANAPGAPEAIKNSYTVQTSAGTVLLPSVTPNGQALTKEQAISQFQQTGGHLGIFKDKDAATNAANSIASKQDAAIKAAAPQKVSVDAKGNVIRQAPAAEQAPAGAQAAPAPAQSAPAESDNSKTIGALGDLATLAPAVLRGGVTSGLSSGAQLTGRALARLALARAGGAIASGAGAIGRAIPTIANRAYLPVTALSVANRRIGDALSTPETGRLSALQGIAQAAVEPSFDEKAADAHFDQIQQQINMTLRSTNLSEKQQSDQLAKLLQQRDILWSAMHQDAANDQDFGTKGFR